MKKLFYISVLSIFLSNCSALGNFVVPPHPKSDFREQEKTCIYVEEKGIPKSALAGMAASAAIGYLVDRVADGIEEEAGRYKASYSARKTFHLFKNTKEEKLVPDIGSFSLVRWVGKSVKDGSGGRKSCSVLLQNTAGVEEAIRVSFWISPISNSATWEVKGKQILLKKTKAKVSEPRWWIPWSWWLPLSDSSGKVDLSATLVISGVTMTKDGSRKHSDFIKVDLPLGENLDLQDDDKKINTIDISDVTSGYFVIPTPVAMSQGKKNRVPVTLSLTIHESDDIGDLIAKGGKKISENKQQIINFSLKNLGYPTQDDKGNGGGNNNQLDNK